MKRKLLTPIIPALICFLLITLSGCNSSSTIATTATKSTDTSLKIHYIDVGQGDSELIQVNGKNILIDAGTNDKKSLNYLESLKITKLDYVIATHPHEDHIGSMADVINTFDIGTFYAPKVTTTTATFKNMINALKSKNLKITAPSVGDKLTIGNATLTFLAPNKDKYEDLNNYSIVCKLKFGNTSYLFTGDAEALSEGEILAKQLDVQADVLKVGHHGSKSSTSQAFLNKVNPKYAIIEVGKGNDYGHPANTTINKLNAKGIKVFRTDLNGTIILTSDGNNITFNTQPESYNGASNKETANNSSSEKKSTSSDSNSNSSSNTNSSSSGSNSSSSSSSQKDVTTNEPAKGDRIVYWTPGGKSYHYNKNCRSLARSKTILEGPASTCPKTDPCNNCVR